MFSFSLFKRGEGGAAKRCPLHFFYSIDYRILFYCIHYWKQITSTQNTSTNRLSFFSYIIIINLSHLFCCWRHQGIIRPHLCKKKSEFELGWVQKEKYEKKKWVEKSILVRFEKCIFCHSSRFIRKKWDTKIKFKRTALSRVDIQVFRRTIDSLAFWPIGLYQN